MAQIFIRSFTAGIYDYLIINGRGGAASRDEMHTTLEYEACKLFDVEPKRIKRKL